jgi:hypothetical protein
VRQGKNRRTHPQQRAFTDDAIHAFAFLKKESLKTFIARHANSIKK